MFLIVKLVGGGSGGVKGGRWMWIMDSVHSSVKPQMYAPTGLQRWDPALSPAVNTCGICCPPMAAGFWGMAEFGVARGNRGGICIPGRGIIFEEDRGDNRHVTSKTINAVHQRTWGSPCKNANRNRFDRPASTDAHTVTFNYAKQGYPKNKNVPARQYSELPVIPRTRKGIFRV